MSVPKDPEKAKQWIGRQSESHKGHHSSESTEFKKGEHRSVSTEFKKGSSGFIGKHTLESRQKMSNSLRGRKAWNFGKHNVYSKESLEKMSMAHMGKYPSEESKNKNRESQLKRKWQYKDTSIELQVESELIKRNINYQKQVPLCKIAIVDFYLPEYRIVIECDGDYWHNRPITKEKDEMKTRVLTFNGFNVYRFWGSEINRSAEECINKLNLTNNKL